MPSVLGRCRKEGAMTVWMCSGQGAQSVGMGASLIDVPEVKEVLDCASEVLDVDLVHLIQEGSEEEINNTFNAQALTMSLSVGIGKALMAQGKKPDVIIGFSLGQISALALADILSVHDAFALLKVRANAMADACTKRNGAMLALLGANHEDAEAVCKACSGEDLLLPANYNCPGQVVISGDVAAIDRAEENWKGQKKKCARLKTAGAFHSPLMQPAADALSAYFASEDAPEFNQPTITLVCNTDAQPFQVEEAVTRLAKQVISPVLFEQSALNLIEQGQSEFVEIGHGGVLFNLMKRISKDVSRVRVGTREQFDQYLGA
jgi:[acyl-carrier-protein] S-malonyltransferase